MDEMTTALPEKPALRAYLGIRAAILSGDLPPGTHLREEALAESTGTSRTPVREALRRLVTEGLATGESRHRHVADFSVDEIMVMFDLRARFESYAARLATTRITEAELAEMDRLIDQMDHIDQGSQDEDTAIFLDLNGQFHQILIDATRSAQIKGMVRPVMSAPVALLKQFVMHQPIGIAASNMQHREILRALRARNADWAEAATKAHVISTRPRIELAERTAEHGPDT